MSRMLRFALLVLLALSGASARSRTRSFSTRGTAAATSPTGQVTVNQASTTHVSSQATCSAFANAYSDKYVKDETTKAVNAAWAIGCGVRPHLVFKNFWGQLVEENRGMAQAYAKTITEAVASCTTSGAYSKGCAAAKGKAKAIAEATASVYSAAVAAAKNKCPFCWRHNSAESAAAVETKLMVDLIAEAESKSFAAVCSSGDDSKYASSYSECIADTIAYTLARATASAFISGGCWSEAHAQAFADATAKITVDQFAMCVEETTPKGPGTVAFTFSDALSDNVTQGAAPAPPTAP